jgi:LacI family transcriptional regulator
MAIGALSALREAGVQVPEEVAVAGFDDIPIARYMCPPLSSVHVPISELGGRAMAMLLEAVGEKNPPARRQETLATTLVIRESCGGARHAAAVQTRGTGGADGVGRTADNAGRTTGNVANARGRDAGS